MMNPFSSLWQALRRLAESFNRLADSVDAMNGEVQARVELAETSRPELPETNGRRRLAAK